MAEQKKTGSYISSVIEQSSQHVDWDKEREGRRGRDRQRCLGASFNNTEKQRARDNWHFDRMDQLLCSNLFIFIFFFPFFPTLRLTAGLPYRSYTERTVMHRLLKNNVCVCVKYLLGNFV